jgi:uncharacterized membrane protein (DUF4010 family)
LTAAPTFAALSSRQEWPLFVALAIGLLIGAEREQRKGEGPRRAPEGIRTFALAGLLGGLVAATGSQLLILLAGGFVAAAALAGYALGDREDPGLTGEFALMATFVLGVLARSQAALAFELGVLATFLLASRSQLHRLAREWISEQELRDVLVFAVAAVVILPLLPRGPIDPFGLLNPYVLWRLAVVVMAINLAGHLAQRLVGDRYGLLIGGLSAGLISSTAAVVAMGARSRANPGLASPAAAGSVASMVGSLGYLFAIISAVSPDLIGFVLVPISISCVAMLAYAGFLTLGAPPAAASPTHGAPGFGALSVLLFVVLTSGFTLLSDALAHWLGAPGALAGAAVTGIADAHAAAASMATLHVAGQLAPPAAAMGVLLGLTSNMAIKIPTAFLSGSRAYALRVTVGVVLLVAALWAGWVAWSAWR